MLKSESTRRDFVKAAGAGVVGTALGTSAGAAPSGPEQADVPWGFLMDAHRCKGCLACVVACKTEYQVPLGAFRCAVKEYEYGDFPKTRRAYIPTLCNQCTKPACVEACPTDVVEHTFTKPDGTAEKFLDKAATFKRPDGIVKMDHAKCTGCGKCIDACPYGVRFRHADIPAGDPPPDKKLEAIDKCDWCIHRLEKGIVPSCVNTCPGNARVAGNLNDPDSEISKRLAEHKDSVKVLLADKGTSPQCFYIRTNGKLCARGQAGIGQSYDPDRLLYPIKHVGDERGDGKWKRISWDEALGELTTRLKGLRDAGTPEKFMFHYGRMKASSSKIVKSYFLPAYGTGTIGNHTSICEGAKWTGQELVWGKHYDVVDVTHTNFILNFGCNALATHTNHIPLAQRISNAMSDRDVSMVTFDVRLSETAAKSREWVPIKPGTDLAVVLAMCNVLVSQDKANEEFINTWTNIRVPALKKHLAKYTPQWAEGISGVPAAKIEALANEYYDKSPSCILSYRGAVAHYNGVQCERAIQMLEAIAGNIDVKGGRCKAVGAKWKNTYPTPPSAKAKLKIIDGDGSVAYPTHHICEHVLKQIKDGSHGRPDIYMIYCYNPAYVNGECQENIEILKDKSLIPYFVAVDVSYGESTSLADLILPDSACGTAWSAWQACSYFSKFSVCGGTW